LSYDNSISIHATIKLFIWRKDKAHLLFIEGEKNAAHWCMLKRKECSCHQSTEKSNIISTSKQERSNRLKQFASYKHKCRRKRSIAVAILYKIQGQDQRAECNIETRVISSFFSLAYRRKKHNCYDLTKHWVNIFINRTS